MAVSCSKMNKGLSGRNEDIEVGISTGGMPCAMSSAAHISARLYSPIQIVVGTFWGTPLAGVVMMARNYWALGQPVKCRRVLLYGLGLAFPCLVVQGSWPADWGLGWLPVAWTVMAYWITRMIHRRVFDSHISAGGSKASWWGVVLIVVASVLFIFGVMFFLGGIG
jgi:hypothetical protein